MFEVKHIVEEMKNQTNGVYVDYTKPVEFSMEFQDLIEKHINL